MRSHPRGALLGLTCLLLATRAGGEEVKTRRLGEAIQAEGVRCMTRQELVQNVELWLGRGRATAEWTLGMADGSSAR